MPDDRPLLPDVLLEVLGSAARLQAVVPDAVLVGETAVYAGHRLSFVYAGHRLSFDHDHVLELKDRYEAVLEAVEATDGWATSVRESKPPMTIMGTLGGVEAGLRQLRRRIPLETEDLALPHDRTVRIPTRPEALRVKAYLVVQRNQVRDYLDVAALSSVLGLTTAAGVLSRLDDYYVDRSEDEESVVSALVVRLAHPTPRDRSALADLQHYKGLVARWQDWSEVTRVCADLAQRLLQET